MSQMRELHTEVANLTAGDAHLNYTRACTHTPLLGTGCQTAGADRYTHTHAANFHLSYTHTHPC